VVNNHCQPAAVIRRARIGGQLATRLAGTLDAGWSLRETAKECEQTPR